MEIVTKNKSARWNLFDEYGHERAMRCEFGDLRKWLSRHRDECQLKRRYLDEDTSERIYWHFGYLCAVRDILKQLRRQRRNST